MNFFGPKPPPANTPTVSTEPAEPQIGFWRKNRTSAYLFGGCIVLLLASRACNSHQQAAQKAQKAEHVEQQSEREQSDKDSEISQLHAQLFNAQRTISAAQTAESAGLANPLTPAQMQQMAAAGGGTIPTSMLNGGVDPQAAAAAANGTAALQRSFTSEGGEHAPARPVTLVISYRQEEAHQEAAPANAATQAADLPQPAPQFPQPPASVPAGTTPPAISTPESAERSGPHNPTFSPKTPNPEDMQHELASSTGEKYRIREGTWIPCTEQLRINGFFAGNINCLVSIPIYSPSGDHLLIPQGTVALGHAAAVSGQNQQRLFVVFDEFIMPDGYTVNYDNATGLDQIGQTGLRDKVDHHYLQVFGVSVGLAALSGLSQIGNYGNSAITTSSQYRAGVTQSLSESSLRILDKFSNILPTFVIREGARNNIHLPFNLWLPDYSKHTMKGDL